MPASRSQETGDLVDDPEQQQAPKSGNSGLDNNHRRRTRKGNNGQEASPSSANSATKVQKQSSSRRRRTEKTEGSSSGTARGGSVMWTILLIGVVFTMLDVLYIIGFVERQEISKLDSETESTKSSTSTSNTSSQNEARISIQKADKQPPATANEDGSHKNPKINANSLADKAPILKLLTEAGFHLDPTKEKELIGELPTWSDVVSLYGPEPVIFGMDNCEHFQTMSDRADHFVSTAGTFNSGTNLMAELLIANCHMQDRMDKYGVQNRGVRWQVPWGKHTPPGDEEFRQSHKTLHDANVDANNILPAVTIRDPLVWLKSMCKHEYGANWDHSGDHCPNFSLENLKTKVRYAEFTRDHDSILHFWNDYYREYLNVEFPRLIVRFEDLVFRPKEVTTKVCECAGGSMRPDGTFKYIVNSAKKGAHAHGKVRTGYLDAIIKYGSGEHRYEGLSNRTDLEYIDQNVDKEILTMMGYPEVDLTKAGDGR